jgi:hypothetical protein
MKGGHCLVAWDYVVSPREVGGFGLPNMRLLNLSLRCHWAWLQRVYPTKAWAEFILQIPHLSSALLESAMAVIVGD